MRSLQSDLLGNSKPIGIASATEIFLDASRTILVTTGDGVAGGTGFEPVLAESESAVLPLDDPPFEIGDIGMKLDYTLPPKITMGAANQRFEY